MRGHTHTHSHNEKQIYVPLEMQQETPFVLLNILTKFRFNNSSNIRTLGYEMRRKIVLLKCCAI